jgi:hypothetical protein
VDRLRGEIAVITGANGRGVWQEMFEVNLLGPASCAGRAGAHIDILFYYL